MGKRLCRSTSNVKISGVCAGIAEYFGIDPSIVRILWVVLSFMSVGFPGIVAYIACAFILPRDTDVKP
jgi:Putative stress-responsive transcriptional regulator